MPDITTTINSTNITAPSFDWAFASGDLQSGDDLQTMVILCLFTDRRAPPDFVPPDGSDDPRGWWGDPTLGSRLWTLQRAKKTDQRTILKQAKDYCKEALQVFLDEGIAAKVEISTYWNTPDHLGITINLYQPQQVNARVFQFQSAWSAV